MLLFWRLTHKALAGAALLAGAAAVHDLSSVEARQLAETIVAVHNRPLHNLCVSQQETRFYVKTWREDEMGAEPTLIKL